MTHYQQFDVVIIGGGIAGLSVALRLPAHLRVALLTKGQLGESNTRYAQGGLAVALGADDSSDLHLQDTLAAGAGLCDEAAVRILVEQAPAAARWLIQMGVQFDRAEAGNDVHATPDGLLLGREGAHSRWRILHAGGDATGAEIERALTVALRARPSIELFEETYVDALVVQDGRCVGLQAIDHHGASFTLQADACVLANGGAGGLWLHTSNPSGATADGLALAWRAGAVLTDLEFMQFHPTVLAEHGSSHLISEAVRGEGAYLRNHASERFMPRYSPQLELAPRDVVARAILQEMVAEQTEYQYLDLRHLPSDKMYHRFPTISAICKQYGLDLAHDLIPVAPAAHYFMGGVHVDTEGRTTVPGLFAVGEVACTGVHGANRLASNSLLEGLVYGIRVADHLTSHMDVRAVSDEQPVAAVIHYDATFEADGQYLSGSLEKRTAQQVQRDLRQLMWKYVSLSRDHDGLLEARRQVCAMRREMVALPQAARAERVFAETANMLLVAELVIAAALERRESRGSHWRLDYQKSDERLAKQHVSLQSVHIETSGLSLRAEEVLPRV
ncbi:MAG TPA: L-aspartate oxidase [Dictyobacter sp.]|jgi:L-aspartate oxidase|nr:L-aspartate oxidase [Dictyobacter sp.]